MGFCFFDNARQDSLAEALEYIRITEEFSNADEHVRRELVQLGRIIFDIFEVLCERFNTANAYATNYSAGDAFGFVGQKIEACFVFDEGEELASEFLCWFRDERQRDRAQKAVCFGKGFKMLWNLIELEGGIDDGS